MDNAWWKAYYMPVMDYTELLNDIAQRLDDGGSCDLWSNEALRLPPHPYRKLFIFRLIEEHMVVFMVHKFVNKIEKNE